MPRASTFPISPEGAERVRAILKEYPGSGQSRVAALLGTDRRRLKRVCEEYGIEIVSPYKRHPVADRPIIRELFTEFERKGMTQTEIARRLGRGATFINLIRRGTHSPNLFDLECLAEIAGMELTAVKVTKAKQGKRASGV